MLELEADDRAKDGRLAHERQFQQYRDLALAIGVPIDIAHPSNHDRVMHIARQVAKRSTL